MGTCGMAGGMGNAADAFRTRSFIPSLSTSNSARSCCRTSSRIRSISSNSIILRVSRASTYSTHNCTRVPQAASPARLQYSYRHVGQHFAAALDHQHIVLDPDAADARHVRARLDREHHPGHDRLVGQRPWKLGNPWIFMYFQSKPMPGSMPEGFRESVARENVAGRTVDVARPNARL